MKWLTLVLALGLSVAMTSSLFAQGRGNGRGPGMGRMSGEMIDRMLKDVKLTDEQKAKIDEVKKEIAENAKVYNDKVDGILSADQKKARDDAIKAANAAGKNERDARRAGMEAAKPTDEQKKKLGEAGQEMGKATQPLFQKLMDILTPEQKEQVKKNMPQRRNAPNRRVD
jgi:Spy/CpxP family protein refolding chaperone